MTPRLLLLATSLLLSSACCPTMVAPTPSVGAEARAASSATPGGASTGTGPALSSAADAARLSCHYLFDNKEGVPEWLEVWMQRKLDQQAPEPDGVLGRADGGGPGGAQWNPNTDLFCVVVGDSPRAPLTVRLNGSEVPVSPVSAADQRRQGFVVPLATLIKLSKLVPASDLSGPEDMLREASAVRIEASLGDGQTAAGMFYWAEGE